MRAQKLNKLIFSVFKSNLSYETNINNHKETLQLLKRLNIDHKVLMGRYKDDLETSILVLEKHLPDIIQICKLYDQESLLHVNNEDQCTLYFMNGTKERIGTWTKITQQEAGESDAWTLDPSTLTYYKAV